MLNNNRIYKVIFAFIIVFLLGFMLNNYNFYDFDYALTEHDARENYNIESVRYLNFYCSNTNSIISPYTVQSAYYKYMQQNDIENDKLFEVFGNGYYNFETSGYLLDDPIVKTFTAGLPKNNFDNADIKASINDPFVLDEINAKLNTLTDNKVLYKVNNTNVFNYNIFGLCVLDTDIIVDNLVECNDDTYLVQLSCDFFEDNNTVYVEIPLKKDGYSLILKKTNEDNFDKFLPLYTEKRNLTLRLPSINQETVDYASKKYVNTDFGLDFNKDSNLNNLTMICHLNLNYVENIENTEDIASDNIYDFSKDCNFYIRNDKTGVYLILGNLI